MSAIDTLRLARPILSDDERPTFDVALSKLETLLQAAETVAAWDGTGRARLDALAAAVRDAEGDTT